MTNLHCLVQDNDSHWYVIPVDRQDDWSRWLEDGDKDEFGDPRWDDAPSWADSIGGSPSLVEFHWPSTSSAAYKAGVADAVAMAIHEFNLEKQRFIEMLTDIGGGLTSIVPPREDAT